MEIVDGGLAFLRVEHMLTKAGSVGFIMPSMEGRLVDDDGNIVPLGQPGEFWCRGPNIMKCARFTHLCLVTNVQANLTLRILLESILGMRKQRKKL